MNFLTGQTVKLTVKAQTGLDPMGAPVYAETTEDVNNVLISPTADAEIITDIQLYGKASTYTLSIPKGDTHIWTSTKVSFWGKDWRTIGPIVEYQEELTPGPWNKRIKVVNYE